MFSFKTRTMDTLKEMGVQGKAQKDKLLSQMLYLLLIVDLYSTQPGMNQSHLY